jgi:hypothetical protein
MARALLVSLILAGWFGSQLVAVPHSHGHSSPAHDAKPHFHWHGHSHGHTHVHAKADECAQAPAIVAFDHDDDACYAAANATSVSISPEAPSQPAEAAGPLVGLAAEILSAQGGRAAAGPSPEPVAGLPRFLMLRTLRI